MQLLRIYFTPQIFYLSLLPPKKERGYFNSKINIEILFSEDLRVGGDFLLIIVGKEEGNEGAFRVRHLLEISRISQLTLMSSCPGARPPFLTAILRLHQMTTTAATLEGGVSKVGLHCFSTLAPGGKIPGAHFRSRSCSR